MTEHRLSPEMAAKLAVVREAKKNLQDKHVKWIIEAAMGHFAKTVEATELEILRYEHLPELPMFSRYGQDRGSDFQGTTRAAEIAKLRVSLEESYAILAFLQALSDAELVRNAEVFAAELRDSGFFGGAPRAGRRGGAR